LTIDHVIPQSRGGKNSFENCVTSCFDCNNKKGNRTPNEANMYMKRRPYSPTISEFLRLKVKQMGLDKFLKELGVF
jgi:5-methylcytosine-specific restriction endonuclease McrA